MHHIGLPAHVMGCLCTWLWLSLRQLCAHCHPDAGYEPHHYACKVCWWLGPGGDNKKQNKKTPHTHWRVDPSQKLSKWASLAYLTCESRVAIKRLQYQTNTQLQIQFGCWWSENNPICILSPRPHPHPTASKKGWNLVNSYCCWFGVHSTIKLLYSKILTCCYSIQDISILLHFTFCRTQFHISYMQKGRKLDSSKFLTGQDRIGQEELHLSQQETRGENVSAIKLHTWKDDKHRQDSTAVVQGERPVGVTELPQSIRLLTSSDPTN